MQSKPNIKNVTAKESALRNQKKINHHSFFLEQNQSQPIERGDPDGDCGINEPGSLYVSKGSEQKSLSTENFNVRKGWLLKQGQVPTKWNRHWFSLKGSALFYYRDQVTEERGVLDGVLDVNNITSVNEISVKKHYGFQLNTWDEKQILFAAPSAEARSNWIHVIKNAAGLSPSKTNFELSIPGQSEQSQLSKLSKAVSETEKTSTKLAYKPNLDLRYSDMSSDGDYCHRSDSIEIVEQDSMNKILGQTKLFPTMLICNTKPLQDCDVSKSKKCKTFPSNRLSSQRNVTENIRPENLDFNDLVNYLKSIRYDTSLSDIDAEKKNNNVKHDSTDSINVNQTNNNFFRNASQNTGSTSVYDANEVTMKKKMNSFNDLSTLDPLDFRQLDKSSIIKEYKELKIRFERAIDEVRVIKEELKKSYFLNDSLEIQFKDYKSYAEHQKRDLDSEVQLLVFRIEDLASKLAISEKSNKNYRQKLMRTERRRTSVKGRENVQFQKDFEEKISLLEKKIDTSNSNASVVHELSVFKHDLNEPRLRKKTRRKSLDSPSSHSMQMILRLKALEKKIENVNDTNLYNMKSNNTSAGDIENQVKYLESVVIEGRETIKRNLKYLQEFKSQKGMYSDKKDIIKTLEKCLTDTLKILNMAKDVDPEYQTLRFSGFTKIKLTLAKIENQVRLKLGDLLVQRRLLKDTHQLTPEKEIELLAERVAFESVTFGRLRAAIDLVENEENKEGKCAKMEVIETIQLMAALKNRLQGKTLKAVRNTTDVLVSVLTQRLVLTASKLKGIQSIQGIHLSPTITNELQKKQNELNLFVEEYKLNILEQLSFIIISQSSNVLPNTHDLLEITMQDIWNQAFESVNFDLIQSEITRLMLKTAQKLKASIESLSVYNFNIYDGLMFESIADAAEESLKIEMDTFRLELSQYCQSNCNRIWQNMTDIVEQKQYDFNDVLQTIEDFTEIIAQKSLIDARINVLMGKNKKRFSTTQQTMTNVTNIQNYEDIFCTLCSEQEVASPEEIFLDADFGFLFNYFETEFLLSELGLKEIVTSLSRLEDTIKSLCNMLSLHINFPNYDLDDLNSCIEKICALVSVVENVMCSIDTVKTSVEGYQRKIEKFESEYVKMTKELQQEQLNKLKFEEKCTTLTRNLQHFEELCVYKNEENAKMKQQMEEQNGQLNSLKIKLDLCHQNQDLTEEKMSKNVQINNVSDKVLNSKSNEELVAFSMNKKEQNVESIRERYLEEIEQLRVSIIK